MQLSTRLCSEEVAVGHLSPPPSLHAVFAALKVWDKKNTSATVTQQHLKIEACWCVTHPPSHPSWGHGAGSRSCCSTTGGNGQDSAILRQRLQQLCVPGQARSCLTFGGRDAGVQGKRSAGCSADKAVGGRLMPRFPLSRIG